MLELINTRPDTTVQESEFHRLLGYPNHHVTEGRSRELADWARQWYAENGRPWTYARLTDALNLAGERIRIHDTEFTSKQLREQLIEAESHGAVLVAVSAGKECEEKARELWQAGKPDEYFFLEMYGSAVVEHLIATTGGRICAWADQQAMAVLPHYSPGYSGWDISDQIPLWKLIRRNNTRAVPEIDVMESGMLRPKKSLLAVLGITRRLDKVRRFARLVPCEDCSLPSCQYRRTPYRRSLPQIEDVRRLQAGGDVPDGKIIRISVLNHNARYSINARALRKWSQERLHLEILEDRSVKARFRYEGTTCSNLGHPLEFDYHVRLGPPDEGHKILETNCAPATGDTGHAAMCEYLSDARSLMSRIANERPLAGRPLNDVLSWTREYSPSGCYCDAARRAHKWGLVLEVIHYALVQCEKETAYEKQETAG